MSENPSGDATALENGQVRGQTEKVLGSAIWLYFWLLMLEGPLRKWILPGLANPLLLIRDPVMLLIYVLAIPSGLLRLNFAVSTLSILGLASSVTGMLFGTQDVRVTAYGFDVNFFHLPLMFIIGDVFGRRDVIKVGRAVMLIAIPMAGLMVLQFRSDPFAVVNYGPGAVAGSQMAAVLGKIRPPGFFTFIAGAAQFLTLATVFALYGMLKRDAYHKVFVVLAGVAIVVSAAVSTSRLALGGIGVVFLMIGVVGVYDRRVIRGVAQMLLPIGLVFLIATNLDVFHEGTYVFQERLELTGDRGGGVTVAASNWSERVLGDLLSGFKAFDQSPIFGFGLGYGTNVGSRLLTGAVTFLADEREWGRVIIEMGPILGIVYIVVRVGMVFSLFSASKRSAKEGNYLPMLLFGACFLGVLCGQFGVSFTMSFAVFCAGLCLAASKGEGGESEAILHSTAVAASIAKRIGRSPHAAALHGSGEVKLDSPPI